MTVTASAPGNPLQEFYETPGVPLSSGPDRARRQARMLARLLRDRTDQAVVIDLGCGDGSALAVAAGPQPAHRFVGIDWSGDALRQARALGLTVIRADLAAPGLPVADGAADVVIMSELIEHLVDPDGAVAEAWRVLRPGGSLLLSTPNLAAWYNRGLLALGIQPVFSEVSLHGVFGRPGRVVAGHLRLFTRRALTEFLTASGFRCVTVAGARYHDVPRLLGPLDRAFCRWPSAASILLVHARKDMLPPTAQVPGTRIEEDHAPAVRTEEDHAPAVGTEEDHAPAAGTDEDHAPAAGTDEDHAPATDIEEDRAPTGRPRRGLKLGGTPGPRRRRALELGGLAIGIIAGVSIALAWLLPARHHPARPAAPSTHAPVLIPVPTGQPNPAALDGPSPATLDEEWIAYSDHSTCADWAGGDGVSAIRLNSSQLAWFFSDTFMGPAGPAIGFSHLSGFVHNAVVIQTTTGPGSTFVTMTGGGACTGPGGPGNAVSVVGASSTVSVGNADRYWDEDGIEIGGTVVKFYDHYRARSFPFVPVGTEIATFPASQLSSAGHGSQYGAVAQPTLVSLPSYTPPSGGAPILWGAAVLRVGNMVYIYGTQSPNVQVPGNQLYLARVPASQLTTFSAWRFYTGVGVWLAGQKNAEPVQPPGNALSVSSGFSVIHVGDRYWLIQGGVTPGVPDIYAYPASAPWGPFDARAGRLLYRDPTIGLNAADDYRILYEARVEPALSTPDTLVISYNVNSEAVNTGCVPMTNFTNTVTVPRFIVVPMTALGADPGAPGHSALSGPQDDPGIVPGNPTQWFDAWAYPGTGCPPVPGLGPVQATLGTGKVTLTWPDAGLGVHYRVYLQEPGGSLVRTVYADYATISGLPPGKYQVRVVPVNLKKKTGSAAQVTFTVP